ncbi:MAG: HEAT repeat domain-containing protein [Armatimonadota bacterium]
MGEPDVEPDVEPVISAEPQKPRIEFWRDYRDDEDKGYFCRQENGGFVAYLNWAGAADLQRGLFGLGTDYEYHEDIHIPYDGFAAPPPGNDAGERIGYNEVCLVSDEKRAQYNNETRFRYAARYTPYNQDSSRLDVYVSRAEAYEAFVTVYDLRTTKTARLFDLIQLYYVEDAITPEDLQEQTADWPTDQDIVPFLIESLDSLYFRTRQLAAEMLRKYPSPRAVAPLIALLDDTEDDVRSEAAETLGFLQAAEAVPALCRAADSRDSYLRTNVAEALGAIGVRTPETADVLLRLLEDENEVVRCFAAEALGDLRETSAKHALESHLSDVTKIRVWACYALVRLGEPMRWDIVLEALADRSEQNARLQAVMVLYWLADEEELAPRILTTLQDARKTETSPKIIERLEEYIGNLTETV